MAISKELFVKDGPARVVLCDGITIVQAGEGVTLTVLRLSLTGVHADRAAGFADGLAARATAVAVEGSRVDAAFEWGPLEAGQTAVQRNTMIRQNLRGQVLAVDGQTRVAEEQFADGAGEALP